MLRSKGPVNTERGEESHYRSTPLGGSFLTPFLWVIFLPGHYSRQGVTRVLGRTQFLTILVQSGQGAQ